MRPALIATGVNSFSPEASPSAYTPWAVVSWNSFTLINPRSVNSTPAASRFNPSVWGIRPVAQITFSAAKVVPSSKWISTVPSSSWTNFCGTLFVCNVGPDFSISATSTSIIEWSKLRKGRSRRTKRSVFTPSACKTPESSTAIYPAPKIATDCGSSSHANTSSEVPPSSFPSTFGMAGFAPVAITIWLARYSSPFTSIVWASTKRAYPLITVTLLRSKVPL